MADELTRRPLSDALSDALRQQDDPDALRAYGLDQLKRGMWKDLGVDYKTEGSFDDSPTMEEARRQNAFGKPSVSDLQDREIQMELQLQRPLTPDQLFPPPKPKPIHLVPVEHNPHNPYVHLVSVDEDPFA